MYDSICLHISSIEPFSNQVYNSPLIRPEQLGFFRCLAQGHFAMWVGAAKEKATNPVC